MNVYLSDSGDEKWSEEEDRGFTSVNINEENQRLELVIFRLTF